MKKKIIGTFFLVFALFFIILIDLPENVPLKFSVGSFTVDTKINPLSFDITIADRRIKRDFKTKLGLDLQGGSHLVFDADVSTIRSEDRSDAVLSARDIIERRVNFLGVSEANVRTVRSSQNYRITVELPGIQNVNDAISLIGQTAQLEFRELQDTISPQEATQTPVIFLLNKKTGLTGKYVKKAIVQFDQNTGKPAVGLTFNTEGAKLFAEITKRNVGKAVGIFLDEYPLTVPVVSQEILDGQAIITGDFTVDQAKQLAVSINSGALPIPIKLVEERTIGPTLGEAHVQKSMVAGVVGLLAVILFMILYYGKFGVIASITLILYGMLNFAIYRAVPIVLTLPGIAGFILSIGMAVDANILIFERIKEEQRKGKDMQTSLRLGFGQAIDAIKDANITTIIVAFILFNPLNWDFFPQFGLVRGFALTLGIGVLTSLFTGVVITKRLLTIFYRNKDKKL